MKSVRMSYECEYFDSITPSSANEQGVHRHQNKVYINRGTWDTPRHALQ